MNRYAVSMMMPGMMCMMRTMRFPYASVKAAAAPRR